VLTKAIDQSRTGRKAVRTPRSRVRYTVEGPRFNRASRRYRRRVVLGLYGGWKEGRALGKIDRNADIRGWGIVVTIER
jgi:hypothetical protein